MNEEMEKAQEELKAQIAEAIAAAKARREMAVHARAVMANMLRRQVTSKRTDRSKAYLAPGTAPRATSRKWARRKAREQEK